MNLKELRNRINNIKTTKDSWFDKHNKRTQLCPLRIDDKVLYNNIQCTIIKNNSGNGHNHIIIEDEQELTHIISNCMELTPY
jgi:hypothetical protein